MKERVSKLFKDKLVLVMLVLGLLTIVAAAGTMTIYKGNRAEETPYLQMGESEKEIAEQETIRPETQVQKDGPSDAQEEHENHQLAENTNHTEKKEITEKEKPAEVPASEAEPAGAGQENALALNLDFTENSRMSWPVQGNILLDYSMDSTIYFPTLDQYKCNPGMVIQGDISEPVYAPANARVVSVGNSEEIGTYLTLDLGNEYSVICGQLKEVAAVEGEYLEKGQLIGYVAEPTKYYTVEGSNLYLEMLHKDSPVDPLDYLE